MLHCQSFMCSMLLAASRQAQCQVTLTPPAPHTHSLYRQETSKQLQETPHSTTRACCGVSLCTCMWRSPPSAPRRRRRASQSCQKRRLECPAGGQEGDAGQIRGPTTHKHKHGGSVLPSTHKAQRDVDPMQRHGCCNGLASTLLQAAPLPCLQPPSCSVCADTDMCFCCHLLLPSKHSPVPPTWPPFLPSCCSTLSSWDLLLMGRSPSPSLKKLGRLPQCVSTASCVCCGHVVLGGGRQREWGVRRLVEPDEQGVEDGKHSQHTQQLCDKNTQPTASLSATRTFLMGAPIRVKQLAVACASARCFFSQWLRSLSELPLHAAASQPASVGSRRLAAGGREGTVVGATHKTHSTADHNK